MDEDFKDPFDYRDIIPLDFKSKSGLPQVFDEIYKNTENTKIDWRKRELALKKIGRICLGNQGKSETFLQFFNGQIYPNLDIQLADLRSSLMKEACKIISLCARELGTLIESSMVHMMTQYVLFKIAGNSNKVISENSSKCVLNIVKYVQSVKIIINICEQKVLKANVVRVLVAQCIYYIMCLYKKNLIMKTIGILLDTIKSLLSDPNSEVRLTTRRVFLAYKKRFPEDAENFYNELEKNIQKQINEDEKVYWDFTFIKVDNSTGSNSNLITSEKKNKILYSNDKISKSEEVKYNPQISNDEKEIKINNNDINDNDNDNINNNDIDINNNEELNNMNNIDNIDTKEANEVNEEKNVEEKKEFKFTNLNILRKQKLEKSKRVNKSQQKKLITKNLLKSPVKESNSDKKEKEINSEHKHKDSNDMNSNNINSSNNYNNDSNNLAKSNILNSPKNKNNKKKTQTEEKILILVKKLDETSNVNDKLLVFQYLFNDFTQILNDINKFSEVSVRKFIDIHIEFLGSEEKTLVSQIIKNLMRMVFYMNQIFNSYDLESIIKLLMIELKKSNTDSNIDKALKKLIIQLYEVMIRKCNNEELLKILFSLIKETDNENASEYSAYNDYDYETLYDWIALLVPSCGNIFNNLNNFKKYFKKVCLADINSVKIKHLIDILYKTYNDNFIQAYNDETENNKNKILSLMEKNKSVYYQDLIDKLKNKTQTQSQAPSQTQPQKRYSIISDINNNYLNNMTYDASEYEEIPKEIISYAESGDIDSFLVYLQEHKNLIPSFLLLLSDPKFNEKKYVMNLANFTYSLISSVNTFTSDLETCIELFINQVIHLLLTNKKNNAIIETMKEILMIIPFKLNAEKYFKTISQYLHTRNDPLLLESLLMSIKNFILNKKTQNLEKILPYFIEEIITLLNHQTKEVKEQAVYCCVEIIMAIGHKFDVYFDNLPKNQQNLINLFVKKRTG